MAEFDVTDIPSGGGGGIGPSGGPSGAGGPQGPTTNPTTEPGDPGPPEPTDTVTINQPTGSGNTSRVNTTVSALRANFSEPAVGTPERADYLKTETERIFQAREKDSSGSYFRSEGGSAVWNDGTPVNAEDFAIMTEASLTRKDGSVVDIGDRGRDYLARVTAEDAQALALANRGEGILNASQAKSVGNLRLDLSSRATDAQRDLREVKEAQEKILQKQARFEAEYGKQLTPAQLQDARRQALEPTQGKLDRAAEKYARVLDDPLFQKEYTSTLNEEEQARIIGDITGPLAGTAAGQKLNSDFVAGLAQEGRKPGSSDNVYVVTTKNLAEQARSGPVKFAKDTLFKGVASSVQGAFLVGDERSLDAYKAAGRFAGLSDDKLTSSSKALEQLRKATTLDEVAAAQSELNKHLSGITNSPAGTVLALASFGASAASVAAGSGSPQIFTGLLKDTGDLGKIGLGMLAQKVGEKSVLGTTALKGSAFLGKVSPILGAVGSALGTVQDLHDEKYMSAAGNFLTGVGYAALVTAPTGVGGAVGGGLIAAGAATKIAGDYFHDQGLVQQDLQSLTQLLGSQDKAIALQAADRKFLSRLADDRGLQSPQAFDKLYDAFTKRQDHLTFDVFVTRYGADVLDGRTPPEPGANPGPVSK